MLCCIDGFWQSWVHPHEGKRDEVETGEAGSLRIHFTTLRRWTTSMIDGVAALLRIGHTVTGHVHITTAAATLEEDSAALDGRGRRRRAIHRRRPAEITQRYLAQQRQRATEHFEEPLRLLLGEKLVAAAIPQVDSTSPSAPVLRDLVIELAPPPWEPQQGHPHAASDAVAVRTLRQETRLLHLLAMLLRRHTALSRLRLVGVFLAPRPAAVGAHGETAMASLLEPPLHDDALLPHKVLDYDEALASVVTAIVQNDSSALAELTLHLPQALQLQNYVPLLAPYLPAATNELLLLDEATHDASERASSRGPRRSNEEILSIIRQAFVRTGDAAIVTTSTTTSSLSGDDDHPPGAQAMDA